MSERSHLEEITIRSLGVIEQTTLELGPGFTVLTGETGAGKTMILTALSLVLGGKSDSSLVRTGSERLTASASFRVTAELSESALEMGAGVDDGLLILTRNISAEGKSKASAGGVAVTASVLNDLGEELIEIHAQAANMSITKSAKQRDILDRFGGDEVKKVLDKYREIFNSHNLLALRISEIRASAQGKDSEIQSLREFSQNFAQLKPKPEEFSQLLVEISRLSSVEELRAAMALVCDLLSNDENGVVSALARGRKALESVADKDPAIAAVAGDLSESFFLASDASAATYRYIEELEADPQRLDALGARRSELNAFLKRYASAVEPDEAITELIAKAGQVDERMADLSGGQERLDLMDAQLAQLFASLVDQSKKVSKARKKVADALSAQVSEEIHSLAMPHTNFLCEVSSPDYAKKITISQLSVTGADEVSMLLQAHAGGPLVAIAKGASGGELSRVMLALEVVLALSQPVGTYVFDEVDAGVGGKAAIEVGRRLHALSRHAQVIVVTHLPQVAAWADSHFVVRKNSNGFVHQSDVENLSGAERITEIARMLAGHEHSKSAQEHASELLAMRG